MVNELMGTVLFAVLVVPILLVYCLLTYKQILVDTDKSNLSAGIYLGSTLIFVVLLSLYTTPKLHEILAAAAA